MDSARKKQLKVLGKAEVARSSAEIRAALKEANPVPFSDERWGENYKRGTLRENGLNKNHHCFTPRNWKSFLLLFRTAVQVGNLILAVMFSANVVVLRPHLLCANVGSIGPVVSVEIFSSVALVLGRKYPLPPRNF